MRLVTDHSERLDANYPEAKNTRGTTWLDPREMGKRKRSCNANSRITPKLEGTAHRRQTAAAAAGAEQAALVPSRTMTAGKVEVAAIGNLPNLNRARWTSYRASAADAGVC